MTSPTNPADPDDPSVADAATLIAGQDSTMLAPTLHGPGADPSAFDATIAASSIGDPISRAPNPSITRTTVLPRVQFDGVAPSLVRTNLARYQEGDLLGRGGLGEVLRAEDNDIRRPVAIKRMLPGLDSPDALARFIDEIRIVGRLEHPNIVPIHDVGLDEDGRYFFVMKYVEGETIESIIEKLAAGDPAYHRKYSFERRAKLIVGVLEALQYAHARGLLHRDIKPANIMVGPFGEVMLMDWGIAKRLGASKGPASVAVAAEPERFAGTQVGSLIGTPAYMSPEQARGEEDLDPRSDIYSLCVVFHELLCLEHYLSNRTSLESLVSGVLTEAPKHASFVPNPHQSRVPADLAWIAIGGLAKNPDERYPSVDAMLARIQRRLEGDIEVQCPVTFTKSVSMRWIHFFESHPLAGLAAILGAVLLVMGGVAAMGWQIWSAFS